MVTIETKPKTYHGLVRWYVANWRTRIAKLFSNKADAVAFTNNHPDARCENTVLSVGWYAYDQNPRQAIGNYKIEE